MSLRALLVRIAGGAFVMATLLGCERVQLAGKFLAMSVDSIGDSPRKLPHRLADPRKAGARLVVTWVGHATVLIQFDDRYILTDPVFTETVGNLSKRLVEPGLAPESLPPIDAVLISHLHMDHLSLGSLDLLEGRYERLFVPPGGAVYLPSNGILAAELSTWESREFEGMKVTAVPVEHVGFRYGGDISWSTEGYTGYVIEYRGQKVFFGGDTAKSPWMFSATRRRFPELDLAILPIAPIHPREFMCATHIDPVEALDVFEQLGARSMMAIHFDTFKNSLDEWNEAPRTLKRLSRERGYNEERVIILEHGGQRVVRP